MLTVLKKNGAKSTAGDVAKKGSKGRLELFGLRNADGSCGLHFADYGNYGKTRWSADFGTLTAEQVREIGQSLLDLAEGRIDTTHIPFSEVEASASEPTEAVEDETPAVAENATTESSETRA
jgi:hypothetical protein